MIAVFKEEIPFLRLLIFFIVGIHISIGYNLQPAPIWFYLFGILCVALTVLSFTYHQKKVYQRKFLPGIVLQLLVCLSAIIITNQHKEIFQKLHFSHSKSDALIVHLTEEPKIKGDVARFLVSTDALIYKQKISPAIGSILLAMRFDTTKTLNLHYGNQLIIKAKYKPTEPPYNPAEFNYKKFLGNRQVYHQSFINQFETLKIDSNKGNAIMQLALKFKESQVEKFRKYIPNIDARSVASTLILGYRTDLDGNIFEAYSHTGTIHILSVSGMHVAIVVLFLEFFLGFLNRNKYTKLLKTILMISFVWLYSLITGMAPSIERAAIMITLFLIAKLIATRVNPFNIIALSAFIILLIDPFALVDVGFQLSFIAVIGLIYFHPKIKNLFITENKLLDLVWSTISVSIAAQLTTTAISISYFHQFPLCFIVSNLFVVLPATLIMYGGIIFLLIPWPTAIMSFLGLMLNHIINFTNSGLMFIDKIPGANISQIYLSWLQILCFYTVIILATIAFSQKRKGLIYIAFVLVFVFITSISYKNYSQSQQKQAMFFTLRKNTAFALIKGRNALLITDLDSKNYNYKFFVKPYLDSCGIKYVNFINPFNAHNNVIYLFQNKKFLVQQAPYFNSNLININYIVLTANKILTNVPNTELERLLIGGKNPDYIIEKLSKHAVSLNLPYSVLKRQQGVEVKF
ncbi:MAG: ComEC family competence protein [Sphingobacteriales bacterium]|nr:MAG: ComEC family competence protein [Sphingobacteriales bacterium]